MSSEIWQAPAKINLYLEITGRREDGYHTVDTAYQSIDLSDIVALKPAQSGPGVTCEVVGEWAEHVPQGEENLATRAARLIAVHTGREPRVAITIEKRIPVGAGLGGGSSDAAAVLIALARRFAVPDPEHTLIDVARELGADVPYFLQGGTRRGTGVGEQLDAIDPPAERWGILVYPDDTLVDKVGVCLDLLAETDSEAAPSIRKFLDYVQKTDVNSMQELYTRTFEINPVCALEVGWHLFGERYERGTFIVKMRQTLRELGIPESAELPDHLVHVLEALGQMESSAAREFAQLFVVPAVEKMLSGFAKKTSIYQDVLEAVRTQVTARYGQPAQGVDHV